MSVTVTPAGWGDPEAVPQLVAQHIVNTAVIVNPIVTTEYLTAAISEITPETQTAGPMLLQLTLIDPDSVIRRCGICSKNSSGYLQPVDINFPEGTPVWWRLAMVDPTSDLTQPNLTLTFQHRPIAYWMRCFGALGWPSGKVGSTRAQFIKYLLNKMPAELPKNLIGPTTADGRGSPNDFVFICPEINEIQPVASSGVYGTEVVTAASAAARQAGINKLPSVTAASHVTVKGQTPSPEQLVNINTAMGLAQSLGAGALATEALMEACIQESSFENLPAGLPGEGSSSGILQFESSTAAGLHIDPRNVVQCITAFLTKDYSAGMTGYKGAIDYARKNPSAPADQVAQAAQGSGAGAAKYAQWQSEAQKIIEASGALLLGNGTSTTPTSDIASLERGTPDDPDEDSWTCAQRLASEVNFSIFSSPQPHPGIWGNYIYYIDGPTLVAQKPSLYLSLSDTGNYWIAQDPETGKFLEGTDGDGMVTNENSTFDNTAFQVEQVAQVGASNGKQGSAKIANKTRVQRPQTPSQMMFNLILGGAGVMLYNAGDVLVVRNSGPTDGRWIIEDVTHNILGDLFAQITAGPPVFAYPEPQANTTTAIGADGQPVTVSTGAGSQPRIGSGVLLGQVTTVQQGALAGAAQAAQIALTDQESKHVYTYYEQVGAARSTVSPDLFTPANGPRIMDCSKFCILCYRAAGLPDPAHFNYKVIGNTDSVIVHCTKIAETAAKPGDFGFFGGSISSTTHMNLYVGNGQAISMGSPGDPNIGPIEQMGPSGFLGYFRSDVVSSITAAPLTSNVDKGVNVTIAPGLQIPGAANSDGIFGSPFTSPLGGNK
jgi:hypothetical protein